MTEDAMLLDYLLLLRYGSLDQINEDMPLISYAAIAKLVKKPLQTVKRLLSLAVQAKKLNREIMPIIKTKLQDHHIEYLCSDHTLKEWAHLSLIQRARMFHRTFPEIKISATLLQKTYKKHGIRFKFIKRGKKIIDYANQYYFNLFREMFQAIKVARLRDKKLVWVDEAVFTFNTFSTRAWSSKYQSIQVKDAEARIKTMALIAAISEDKGLEAFMIHPKSISMTEFVTFVEGLSQRFEGQEFCMFLDNLQVHKTKEVFEVCERLRVKQIFNVPYSPDFNGIESYFSLVKAEYKKRILQQLMKGIRPDSSSLIKESIINIEKEKVQKCVEQGLKCISQKALELNII